jgi:1-deoxy-D-xylulose-5-phosphate reductoisomerase
MSSIVGIDGLNPTLKIIKYSKNIAIANKESIICAWHLLKKELIKNNTNFIPVDSEHFSIWSSVNFSPFKIEKVYLTASGGPFYKNKFKNLDNVSVNQALKHPTWKMGKKITIDSATLMNKIFEVIEAKKIFNIDYKKIGILIHPSSYIHAIVKFNNGLINVIAHETTMKVPIFNSLPHSENKKLKTKPIDIKKINSLDLSLTNTKFFPTLKILKKMPINDSLFETVLVSANDYLVYLFLEKKISFKQISKLLLKVLNMKRFGKLKNISPKNLNEIFDTKKYTINCIQQLIHNRYV